MKTIEIRNRFTGDIIFTHECADNTILKTVTAALSESANLTGANLTGAYLSPIRDDIWSILSSAPREVPALIAAIAAGNVDGSTYTGKCACLVGTLARAQGISVDGFESLKPNSNRPAERFFMSIRAGDTPETSQFSRLAHDWCVEWLNNMQAAFGVKP